MITWVLLIAILDAVVIHELGARHTPALVLLAALPFSVIGLVRGLRLGASIISTVQRDRGTPARSDMFGFLLFGTLQILVFVLTGTLALPLDDYSIVVAAVASVFLPEPARHLRPLPMATAVFIGLAIAAFTTWSMAQLMAPRSRAVQRAYNLRQAFTSLLVQPPYNQMQSGQINLPVTKADFDGEPLAELYSDRINSIEGDELRFVRYREGDRIVLVILGSADNRVPNVISVGVSWNDSDLEGVGDTGIVDGSAPRPP